jgi:branched-chain amino acid transport system substrate-binding protein
MHRRHFIYSASALAAMVGDSPAWAQAAKSGSGPRKIIVGQSIPMTGSADQIGVAYSAGAKLFFDNFNEQTTKAGWRFELKALDDGYDANKAAANAKKLISENADVLFGFVGTASSDAAAAVAKQSNTVFFAPFAASDTLRDSATHSHAFHVRPSMADEASRIVKHCATLGLTRIAVLAEDDAMGRAGLAAVNQSITTFKLPPLVASAFVPANTDKVDAAVAALQKAQPQAIIQVALFNTTAAFIRKMRKTGYTGAYMNFSVVGLDPLFSALGKEMGGLVVSQVVPSPRSSATPIVKEYLAALDKTELSPSYEGLEGYIAAKTLAEAVRRAGRGFDSASLQKTMSSMTNYDVGGFRVNLRAGLYDSARAIDLVTVTADGKVVR